MSVKRGEAGEVRPLYLEDLRIDANIAGNYFNEGTDIEGTILWIFKCNSRKPINERFVDICCVSCLNTLNTPKSIMGSRHEGIISFAPLLIHFSRNPNSSNKFILAFVWCSLH